MEIESTNTGTIIVAHITPRPRVVKGLLVKDSDMVADTAVDALDTFLLERSRPAVEECVWRSLSIAIGTQHGVAAANNIYVAMQDALAVYLATDAYPRSEPEIATQL